ncbi:hypothetical protein JXA56_03925 [Candidatus Micrarchaeota archaeon]|nr:hypothetical protein [Candidatus Micrarchaeota archaeon]
MTDLLCPKCGATSNKKDFIESFCVDCYPANIKCPTKLKIEQCKRCEKIRVAGQWTKYSDAALSSFVMGKCKGPHSEGSYDRETGLAEFRIEREGNIAVIRKNIILEIVPVICLQCSRISGGYFQGIIQLRGSRKKVEEWTGMLYKKLKKKTFIAKEEEKHGGLDIYVGNSKAVVEILSELRVKATITTKLAGVEQGKRYYRTTFLIRL